MIIPAELPVLLLAAAFGMALAGLRSAANAQALRLVRRSGARHPEAKRTLWRWLADRVASLVSPGLLAAEERRLRRANLALRAEAMVIGRVCVSCLTAGIFVSLDRGGVLSIEFAGLLAASGSFAGLVLVEWWLRSRARRSSSELRCEWPRFLDQLRLCLTAGMSLEKAIDSMAMLSRQHPGALSRDLIELVGWLGAGLSIDRALARWAEVTGASEVAVLASAVERTRAGGLALGPIVEAQRRVARNRQRQACMSWVNALPSRLSVVAMIFFLPAVLVVVLMPSLIAFLRAAW